MSKQQPPYGITYNVTRLDDGRLQAKVDIRQSYRDEVALALSDAEDDAHERGIKELSLQESGTIIWDEGEDDPENVEESIRRNVLHGFSYVPRPILVRIVNTGEGLEPGEKRLTVGEHVPEED